MKKISSLSKKILFTGLTVCAALCITYIVWNAVSFSGSVSSFSKNRLSIEASKLLLICVTELIFGSYLIDRISQAD
ncbi:MAG: hypothetical protein IJS94_03730 [Clostridia bacterium]|nr:hypothetical protein [Clostridia bacterium]